LLRRDGVTPRSGFAWFAIAAKIARQVTGSARSVYWPSTQNAIAAEKIDVVRDFASHEIKRAQRDGGRSSGLRLRARVEPAVPMLDDFLVVKRASD
jgi:hypothetical protein